MMRYITILWFALLLSSCGSDDTNASGEAMDSVEAGQAVQHFVRAFYVEHDFLVYPRLLAVSWADQPTNKAALQRRALAVQSNPFLLQVCRFTTYDAALLARSRDTLRYRVQLRELAMPSLERLVVEQLAVSDSSFGTFQANLSARLTAVADTLPRRVVPLDMIVVREQGRYQVIPPMNF